MIQPELRDGVPVEVRILGVATVNGAMDIFRLAASNPGWEVDREGALSCASGSPLRFHVDTQFVTLMFAKGSCAGKVRVTHNGEETELDLLGEVGIESKTFGERTVLRSVDVACDRGVTTVRIEREPIGPVRILDAWSTSGTVRIEGDIDSEVGELGDVVVFEPAAAARVHPAYVAGGLVAMYVACVPIVMGVSRRYQERGRALVMALWWSLGYASLLTLIFFPGIITPDGWNRLTSAWGIQQPERVPWHLLMADWFPPVLMLLMQRSLEVFGSMWPVAFVQAWMLSAAIAGLMIACLGARWGMIAWAIVIAMPPVWTHAIAMLADGWTTGALCAVAAALAWHFAKAGTTLSTRQGAIFTACVAVGSVILFTFRSNSLTVAPVLIVAIVWVVRSRMRAAVAIACVCAACIASRALPGATMLRRVDTPAASMVWEHAGMLSIANDRHVNGLYNLEFAARTNGATERAIALYRAWPYTHDVMLFASDSPLDLETIRRPDGKVHSDFVQFVRERPDLYLRMKLAHAGVMLAASGYVHVLTLFPHAPALERGAAPDEPAKVEVYESHYGVDGRTTSLLGDVQLRLCKAGERFANAINVVFRPWVLLGAMALVWMIAWAKGRATRTLHMTTLLALAYFGAFFVLSPGLNFRYAMPSWCLAIGAIGQGIACLRAVVASQETGADLNPLRRAA
jgi:hypothetical protein